MTDFLTSILAGLTPDDIGAVLLALAALVGAVVVMVAKRWPNALPAKTRDAILAAVAKITAAFTKKQPPAPPEKPLTAGEIAAKKNGKKNTYNGV